MNLKTPKYNIIPWVNDLWDAIIVHMFNPAARKTSKGNCGTSS